jgi:ketosteroid isomerase-like protein
MSQENVELVRSIFAARERGDFSDAGWAHPEIEYVIVDGPEPTSYKGLVGLAQAMRDMLSPWDHFRGYVEECRELDVERVLVLLHASGRGKASGLELDALSAQQAQVVQVRDGKVTKILVYYDRKRAFADLGLASDAPVVTE